MDKTIIHFEIPANDVEKLKGFYEKLFGWKIIHAPMGGFDYWVIQTVSTDEKGMLLKPGVNGGMYKKADKTQVPVNYVSVDNIDATLASLAKSGGKIVGAKQSLPGVGTFAICLDPEGNPFGIIKPEPMLPPK